jgi:purine-binding chemotaxis protein CheW
MRALLLRIGQDIYAVDMAAAREVVAAPQLQQLPTAPSSVLGVFNLRGEIVPAFDTAMLLGLGPTDAGAPYVAVVETSLGPAGLTMSSIGESVELGEPVGVTETPGTLATYALGGRLVVLVDLEALLVPTRSEG